MAESKSPLKLSVVIPVYNERRTIEELLCRVQAVEVDKEIIIVDNGSTDGTRELLRDVVETRKENATFVVLPQVGHRLYIENMRIFFQKENRGKGAALRRGFREAQGEIVLVQDADLEYDPQDYYKLLAPIERGRPMWSMGRDSWARFIVSCFQISFSVRTYAEGKKITWKDGLKGIWCILRYNVFG